VCLCPLLTGGVIDPLDVRRWVFFKVTEDVLGAHVVHADHVDGLQARLGNRWWGTGQRRTTQSEGFRTTQRERFRATQRERFRATQIGNALEPRSGKALEPHRENALEPHRGKALEPQGWNA